MESKHRINYRILSLILGILLITGNLFSQPPLKGDMQGPKPIPDSTQIVKMVDELVKEISLSDKQKTQVSELYFAHFEEAKELVKQHEGDLKKHRETMDALKEEFDDQVKDLLTEDQSEKFEEYVKKHQQQRKNISRRK